jgi:hypothetical protein
VPLILGHQRLDFGDFPDLVPQRVRIGASQSLAATAARLGNEGNDIRTLFDGNQCPFGLGMARLTGWSFPMKQLHEKSGSAARLSDFAIDIRRVVESNGLPEYELAIHRNEEGDEIVRFVHRVHLSLDHPRREYPRFPGRRQSQGIFTPAWKINALPDDDSGE